MSEGQQEGTGRRARREINAVLIGIVAVIGLYAAFELADVWLSGEVVRHYEDVAAGQADGWATAELPDGLMPASAADIRVAVDREGGGVLLRFDAPDATELPASVGPTDCPSTPDGMRSRGWWCDDLGELESRCVGQAEDTCLAYDPAEGVAYWAGQAAR